MSDVPAVREETEALAALNPQQVMAQVRLIQEIMGQAMRKDEHYGVIPGAKKPSLLKPGAEKLCFTFRLASKYEVTTKELGGEHREVEVLCRLVSIKTGAEIGQGVGSCSTMESKYRYRAATRTCPVCGKPAIIKGKAEYGGGWLCFKKQDGCGAKFADADTKITLQVVGRVENADLADVWNTVLKMAKKRAHVDATLGALAASDIFTQDVEDMTSDAVPASAEDRQPPPEQGSRPPRASEAGTPDGFPGHTVPPDVQAPDENEVLRAKIREHAEAKGLDPRALGKACHGLFNKGHTQLDTGELTQLLDYVKGLPAKANVV